MRDLLPFGVPALAASLLIIGAMAAADDPTALTLPQTWRGSHIELKAWLTLPQTRPPYSAVVIMPGCNGLDRNGWRHARHWSAWFDRQGFATLIVGSLAPRGLHNICGHGDELPPLERVEDLYAAAAYLAKRPDIDARKIVGLGFSHGGWTVLKAAAARGHRPGPDTEAPLAALIAFYPACGDSMGAEFHTPLLILAGSNDDWTSAQACRDLAASHADDPMLRVKIYPGARHSFDADLPPRTYQGHELSYDRSATEKAQSDIEQFLKDLL